MNLFGILCLFACPKTPAPTVCPDVGAPLPTAQEVFDAHQRAITVGPELVWERLHQRGTVSVPNAGIEGTLDIWISKEGDGAYLSRLDIPGMGVTEQGWNGGIGWTIDPNTGPRLLDGEELRNIEFTFQEVTNRDMGVLYSSAKVEERTPYNGHDAYVLRVQVDDLKAPTELYFDACSHLQIGSLMMLDIPVGRMKVRNTFLDYQPQDGMLLPRVVEQSVMGIVQRIQLSEIEWEPVDFPQINPPSEIYSPAMSE